MKKILLSMLAVMATFMTAGAQATDLSALTDAVYVEPLEAPAGSQQTLSVCMKNSIEVQTIQFDLYLPEGLTVIPNEDEELMTASKARINKFNYFQSSVQSDGALRLLAQATTTNIAVGDGEIATVMVSVPANMVLGDYSITVKNILLVSKENVSKTVDEVTTMITVVEPQDSRVVLDETSTTAPTSATGVDVRVKRTIMGGVWNTICLPFAMTEAQVKTAFGEGVQLASFTGWETTEYDAEDNATSIKVTFEPTSAIEANTPYIIKLTNSITEFLVDGVDVAPDDEPSVTVGKKSRGTLGSFTGSYVPITIDEECLFLSEGNFWYSVGKTKMKGFRGYFYFQDLLASYTAGSNARVSMVFTEEPTGISEYGLHATGNGICYDLQGRRVVTPVHGLYIRDGKKVIVK